MYCKVHYWYGHFFLLVPKALKARSRTRKPLVSVDDVVALDPGIHKFLMAYSPQGKVELLGATASRVVDKQTRRVDHRKNRLHELQGVVKQERERWHIQPLTHKERKRHRRWLWRAHRRYYAAELKCKRVIRDLHYNASHYLLENYRHIILPKFNAHAIAKYSKLDRKTKRRLNTLSFCKFREQLLQTAMFYSGSQVYMGSEAYTSK